MGTGVALGLGFVSQGPGLRDVMWRAAVLWLEGSDAVGTGLVGFMTKGNGWMGGSRGCGIISLGSQKRIRYELCKRRNIHPWRHALGGVYCWENGQLWHGRCVRLRVTGSSASRVDGEDSIADSPHSSGMRGTRAGRRRWGVQMGEMSEPAGGEEGAGRESGLLVASTDCFRFLELAVDPCPGSRDTTYPSQVM